MFHIEFALNFLAHICMRKNVVTVIMLLALGSVFMHVQKIMLYRLILMSFRCRKKYKLLLLVILF